MLRFPLVVVSLLAIVVGPPAGAADWQAAVAAFEAGDYAAARQGFEEYLVAQPGFAGAHFMLARTLDRLDDPEAARLAYLRASDLEPGNPSYAFAAARAEIASGEPKAALDRLAQVDGARVDAATASALALLTASAHLKLGAPELAAETLERALESTPDYAKLLAALGTARAGAGDHEGAVGAWSRAFALDPTDNGSAASAVQAALELAEREGDPGATRWLETAVEIADRLAAAGPGDGHAMLAGRANLAAGNLETAATWFDAALASDGSEDPLTLYYSGRTLRCLDRLEPARDRLSRALSASPDADLERSIHRQLARVFEAMLELEKAASHHAKGGDSARARQVEELGASFREALDSRREILERLAQFETMADDLEHIGEADGASRVRQRITDLEAQRRALDANLEEVRAVLRDASGCR